MTCLICGKNSTSKAGVTYKYCFNCRKKQQDGKKLPENVVEPAPFGDEHKPMDNRDARIMAQWAIGRACELYVASNKNELTDDWETAKAKIKVMAGDLIAMVGRI